MSDTGGSAFPEARRRWDAEQDAWYIEAGGGMTLLDYFAGQALTGLTANPGWDGRIEIAAVDAHNLAAAMIAEKRRRESADAN